MADYEYDMEVDTTEEVIDVAAMYEQAAHNYAIKLYKVPEVSAHAVNEALKNDLPPPRDPVPLPELFTTYFYPDGSIVPVVPEDL
jgi:hypothetical protein